jgi:hypothetical protein
MKRIVGIAAVALIVAAGGLAPRDAHAQGACEAAAAMAPALAGAGAVGAVGETVTNVLDRAVISIEQAQAGGPDAQGDGQTRADAPPPPRPAANEPPPLPVGC